jgi:hypothetical protein
MSVLQTDFEFQLPQGYVDSEGTRHREGVMRLATAADEILPQRDPRVQANPPYIGVILLSRVVTRLGTIDDITPPVVEGLFVSDLAYLQDLYERINNRGADAVDAHCPECGEGFEVHVGTQPSMDSAADDDHQQETMQMDSTAKTNGAIESGNQMR